MLQIIGLGNGLRGDDGIGPLIIDQLRNKSLPGSVRITDAGTDPFLVLEFMLRRDPLIVIDCARMGLKPGQARKIEINDNISDTITSHISLHHLSLSEVWHLARALGYNDRFILIGIEPQQMDFNTPVSKTVRNSIPTVLDWVVEEAMAYAKKDSDH